MTLASAFILRHCKGVPNATVFSESHHLGLDCGSCAAGRCLRPGGYAYARSDRYHGTYRYGRPRSHPYAGSYCYSYPYPSSHCHSCAYRNSYSNACSYSDSRAYCNSHANDYCGKLACGGIHRSY